MKVKMKDTAAFITEIKKIVNDNSSMLEELAPDSIQCVWQNINRATNILFKCFETTQGIESQQHFDSLLMLANVITDVINATISICGGFWRGPGTILRGAWEDLACIIVIRDNSDKYEQFKCGKFKATKAITLAKEIYPEFGKYYGLLSNIHTHASYDFIGRSGIKLKDSLGVSIIKPLDPKKLPLSLLLDCSFVVRQAGAIVELCSARILDELHYWRIISDDRLQEKLDTEEDILIQKLMDKIGVQLAGKESYNELFQRTLTLTRPPDVNKEN